MRKRLATMLLFCFMPLSLLAAADGDKTVHSVIIFGDSLSDTGNVNHMLKSINMEEDPAFLVSPFKTFVFRKMDDFANDYYVPNSVLMAGKKLVQEFFDIELSPLLASMLNAVKTIPSFPEPPYWHHHFTNGKVWNEWVAEEFGFNLKDEDEYYNNAFGGSWAATYDHQLTTWNLIRHPIWSLENLVEGKLIPPSLGLEVQGYLMNFGKAKKDALYFVFAGGNDYLNMLNFEDNYNPKYMSQYVDYIVSGIVYSTEKLINAGAKHVALMGIPDVGLTPRFNQTTDHEVLTRVSTLHNERLEEALATLKDKYPDVSFTFINVQEIFGRLFDQAKQYGVTNITEPCVDIPLPGFAFTAQSPYHKAFKNNFVLEYVQYMHVRDAKGGLRANFTQCDSPSSYAFWDVVHPSAVVHRVLGQEVIKALQKNGYQLQ